MIKRPPFLPREIAEISKECEGCGKVLKPNFWTEFREPFVSIPFKGTKGEKGGFVQVGAYTDCKCGGRVLFDIDAKELKHNIWFYGDEAERQLRNYDLFVYSLIGGSSGPIEELENSVRSLKKRTIPNRDPDSWRIHTKDIINSRKRIMHGDYKLIGSKNVIPFFKECADILKNMGRNSWNMCAIGFLHSPSNKKERRKWLKEGQKTIHQALLSHSIYFSTKQNLRPVFTLDASKEIKNDPHIEGWSYDTHNESKYFLANAFLTHSNDIMAPTIVKPGSHPCLELADVHAYFVARSLERRLAKQDIDIPLNDFGTFSYLIMQDNNSMEYERGDEIPDKYLPFKPKI